LQELHPLCTMHSTWSGIKRQSAASATPCPYTTLFRSEQAPFGGRGCGRPRAAGEVPAHDGSEAVDERRTVGLLEHAQGVELEQQDRKSTRLNSSHVKNSYAVFCLKKKRRHRATRRAPA